MDAGLSHGKKAERAKKGGLCVVIKRQRGDRGQSLGDSDRARGDGSEKEARKSLGLFCGEGEGKRAMREGELLRSVQAKSEGKAEPQGLLKREARSLEQRAKEERAIREESQRAPSSAGGHREGDPPVASESETEIRACFAPMGTGLKEESLLEEAFSLGKSSQAGELAPYDGSMRRRRDGSSKALGGEEMKD